MDERRALEINRELWDAAVAPHTVSAFYDVEGFLAGASTLSPDFLEELGPVAGLDLAHLQCHFGLDTLSLGRLGARVTGVDFSSAAVTAARELARRAGLDARFVEADAQDLPRELDASFDRVYTGGGALCWLADLKAWAEGVARLLRPGGELFVREFHPAAGMFGPKAADDGSLRLEMPYFRAAGPVVWTDGLTYASEEGPRGDSVEWPHALAEVVQAVLDTGLHLTRLREYSWCSYPSHEFLVEREGRWVHPHHPGGLPMMFSLRARKPLA